MSDKSDDDFDYGSPEDVSTQNGTAAIVIGTDESPFPVERYTNTEIYCEEIDHVDLSNLIIPGREEGTTTGPEGIFCHQSLWELICKKTVSSILGLVAITGLPGSRKSKVLENLMLKNIQFKQGKARNMLFDYLQRRRERCKDLAVYELPIIGNGPSYHAWFLAYKRCSATLFGLSALLQKQGLSQGDIPFSEEKDAPPVFHSPLLQGQLEWLHDEMKQNYQHVVSSDQRQMLDLLRSGVCLVKVFDLGSNRALQEFFNVISRFCSGLVQLAFFDLKRDARSFLLPPSERTANDELIYWRPRLHYLLRSPNPSKNLFVATFDEEESLADMPKAQQLIKDEVEQIEKQGHSSKYQQPELYAVRVDGDAKQYTDFRRKIDEKIFDLPLTQLSLRWIFLRSCLAVHEKSSLYASVKKIESLGSELGMRKEDVKEFLEAFTKCGSLLYTEKVPSLKENVVIDIQGFAKCIEALFQSSSPPVSPVAVNRKDFLEKQGILSLKTAEEKVSQVEENKLSRGAEKNSQGAEKKKQVPEFVLKTLVDIGMAAKVPSGQLKREDPGEEVPEHYYYLPSARPVLLQKEMRPHSAYIITQRKDLPVDSQARLATVILENFPQLQLVPSMYYNQTVFEHSKVTKNAPRLTITFHREMTELDVDIEKVDKAEFVSPIEMCKQVLEVCLNHLELEKVKFNIGLRCQRSQQGAEYHYLFPKATKPGKSTGSPRRSEHQDGSAEEGHVECLHQSEEMPAKRRSWIEAAEKCEKDPASIENLLLKQDHLVFPLLYKLAKILKESHLSPAEQDNLLKKLGFTEEKELEEIKHFSGSRMYMMMLLKWEDRHGSIGTTKKLANIFHECKLQKAANRIDYEYTST